MNKGFWYFAHPYTVKDADGRYVPEGEQANFEIANARAAELLKRGYNVYSPISHTHPIHRACPEFLSKHEHELWYRLDQDVLERTRFDGIILAPGWEMSTGCKMEKQWFLDRDLPIKFYREILEQETPVSDEEWLLGEELNRRKHRKEATAQAAEKPAAEAPPLKTSADAIGFFMSSESDGGGEVADDSGAIGFRPKETA